MTTRSRHGADPLRGHLSRLTGLRPFEPIAADLPIVRYSSPDGSMKKPPRFPSSCTVEWREVGVVRVGVFRVMLTYGQDMRDSESTNRIAQSKTRPIPGPGSLCERTHRVRGRW
jgi:hypothetical protein